MNKKWMRKTTISAGECMTALHRLVHLHVVSSGNEDRNTDKKVVRFMRKLKLIVGKPMPQLQSKAEGKKWKDHRVKEQVRYQKIAVKGKETEGRKLTNFNQYRASKIYMEALRTATIVTEDLRELLEYLGHTAAVGAAMPQLVKETADGWIPLNEAPRSGDNGAALAGRGTAKPNSHWYLSLPGRDNPVQITKSRTLQGRLDFQGQRVSNTAARFSSRPMTLDEAKAEFSGEQASGDGPGWHSRVQHIARSTAQTQALVVPAGWKTHVGSVILWLFLNGAFLTNTGCYNVNEQIYHVLEYFMSALRLRIAGVDPKFFITNLLQQLDAARDGKYYVKRQSQHGEELCLGYKCWQITFCAFKPGQGGGASGEKTLMDLITDDVVPFKEAVDREQEDRYFCLIVPEGAVAAATLQACKRKIFERIPGDHAVSNERIHLPRLCAIGAANASDYRFLHQADEKTGKYQWTFRGEAELRAAAVPVIKEFLADARAMIPRGGVLLPPRHRCRFRGRDERPDRQSQPLARVSVDKRHPSGGAGGLLGQSTAQNPKCKRPRKRAAPKQKAGLTQATGSVDGTVPGDTVSPVRANRRSKRPRRG